MDKQKPIDRERHGHRHTDEVDRDTERDKTARQTVLI